MKKLQKSDFLFVTVLALGLLMHIYFVYAIPFFDDESFYATIPYRLVNGDSLIQHEWHLSQFSSLFSYLPVWIWTTIKGSADGIFVFLRYTYLVIHTVIAIVIYIFFRKYKKWAVITSMLFYAQVAYRTLAISYQSIFVVFLLLLTFCLVSIYEKHSTRLYVFAGVCFGCCCVCNPFFCIAFILYLVVCALWGKREKLINKIFEIRLSQTAVKKKRITKKQKEEKKNQFINSLPDVEKYACFFGKEAVIKIICGIFIVAGIAMAFFFLTGGTIHSITKNVANLLGSSEYDVASSSFFSKLVETISCILKASLGTAFILPVIFIVLLQDKKKRHNSHRLVYLSVSVLWSVIFMIGTMVIYKDMDLNAVSLPFCLISTVCYCLTEKKNKILFYCIYIPGLVGTFFQYLAANTHLAVIGVVLAVNSVAGVFFTMDLWNEMNSVTEKKPVSATKKNFSGYCRLMIVTGLCLQVLFYGIYYQKGRIYTAGDSQVTVGPYSGMYMTEANYDQYSKEINDMDVIKSISRKDDAVYLASYRNWMYMYLEQPIAAYTTWYRGTTDKHQLIKYYKENPQKIPKYIYVESFDINSSKFKLFEELFVFTQEELSNGVLLTVESKKF